MNREQLEEEITEACLPAFRNSILAKGQARSMIWRDGELPEGAPQFSPYLSYDLKSYAFALLSLSLRLLEQEGSIDIVRKGFLQTANALEAVITNNEPDDPERSFHILLAAAAFHLGQFSARAYSLLYKSLKNPNLSPIENSLALLILRRLRELESQVESWVLGEETADEYILESLIKYYEDENNNNGYHTVDAVILALIENYHQGMGAFLLALESGEPSLLNIAQRKLDSGLRICQELNLVPQWWCYRITKHLLDDLWDSSYHSVLPKSPQDGPEGRWQDLRELFIALLSKREKSEIELWPSQLEGAQRSIDIHDDLVLSLPTSAGKTRVAELCILRTLAEKHRIVFVTPLRALSAQTEETLQKTFGPLGYTITSLYGSIGTSQFEEDVLRKKDIVVATPEKLDFALRNDPSLLDDVGLIVLDEGHMIGLGEREVRYEAQIQRLLRRPDADERRIVCLSAILPSDESFDDFVNWIRMDQAGDAITSNWRPTRLRFGELLWTGERARLQIRVGEERPFIQNFFTEKDPQRGRRRTSFPHDQREMVLASAWRLIDERQSILIYCPERRSVEPYAEAIADLHEQGFIDSVLTEPQDVLDTVLTIGREWLGDSHPILTCLSLGVAIHHGALPTPFRKEMERLLRDGVLKITVSSPTLAQGLNLSATTLLFHSLFRFGSLIPASEFQNITGRAGRAFVDVEGLVLYPIFDQIDKRQSQWQDLINKSGTLSIESGLLQTVEKLLVRLYRSLDEPPADEFLEYIMNNPRAWDFPEIEDENDKERKRSRNEWSQYLSSLDTAILSLAGGEYVEADEVAAIIDEILSSSLWERRIRHQSEVTQRILNEGLKTRAEYIWERSTPAQRRGYFLAGLGFSTGKKLDSEADELNGLLTEANTAILENNNDQAIQLIGDLAEKIFSFPPFKPDPMPDKWREILCLWLEGKPISEINEDDMSDVLLFVDQGLVYKLPWGLEAVRVRAHANEDMIDGELIEDLDVGYVVTAVETGTLKQPAALLIKAGFNSRLAAIKAVEDTEADFSSGSGLDFWLRSEEVRNLTEDSGWPTPETAPLWNSFIEGFEPIGRRVWSITQAVRTAEWEEDINRPPGTPVRIRNISDTSSIFSATYEYMGKLEDPISNDWAGVLKGDVGEEPNTIVLTYYGPDDISLD